MNADRLLSLLTSTALQDLRDKEAAAADLDLDSYGEYFTSAYPCACGCAEFKIKKDGTAGKCRGNHLEPDDVEAILPVYQEVFPWLTAKLLQSAMKARCCKTVDNLINLDGQDKASRPFQALVLVLCAYEVMQQFNGAQALSSMQYEGKSDEVLELALFRSVGIMREIDRLKRPTMPGYYGRDNAGAYYTDGTALHVSMYTYQVLLLA